MCWEFTKQDRENLSLYFYLCSICIVPFREIRNCALFKGTVCQVLTLQEKWARARVWRSQGKNHMETIAWCGTWQLLETTLKISHRVMYKNSQHFHMLALEIPLGWSSSCLCVTSCRAELCQGTSSDLKTGAVSDISDWASDPSFSAEIVRFKICSADRSVPFLAQEITVMRLCYSRVFIPHSIACWRHAWNVLIRYWLLH